MVVKPYTDIQSNKGFIRTFKPTINESELVWHRDRKNRVINVLEGKGWQLQFDNELPFELTRNNPIFIPMNVYHRVIKGTGELKIKVTEI